MHRCRYVNLFLLPLLSNLKGVGTRYSLLINTVHHPTTTTTSSCSPNPDNMLISRMSGFITQPSVVTTVEVVAQRAIPNGVTNMVQILVTNPATNKTANLAEEMIKKRYGFPTSKFGLGDIASWAAGGRGGGGGRGRISTAVDYTSVQNYMQIELPTNHVERVQMSLFDLENLSQFSFYFLIRLLRSSSYSYSSFGPVSC